MYLRIWRWETWLVDGSDPNVVKLALSNNKMIYFDNDVIWCMCLSHLKCVCIWYISVLRCWFELYYCILCVASAWCEHLWRYLTVNVVQHWHISQFSLCKHSPQDNTNNKISWIKLWNGNLRDSRSKERDRRVSEIWLLAWESISGCVGFKMMTLIALSPGE